MARQRTVNRLNRIKEVLSRRQKDLELVLANIHDPHNVSAIFRSCDAFGVSTVHLYYTIHVFPDLKKKSSSSAHKWVQSIRQRDAGDMIAGFQGRGMQVMTTGFGPRAKSLLEYDFTKPTAIIFGNEHSGVDQELSDLVPEQVYIPMQGMVQSLNVSVAAAIILYECWRQRQALGMYERSEGPCAEMETMILQWSEK